jgi:hypothetical protein
MALWAASEEFSDAIERTGNEKIAINHPGFDVAKRRFLFRLRAYLICIQ